MKGMVVKGLAGALLLAGTLAFGASAYAADTAAPAAAAAKPAMTSTKAKCEKDAKDKGLDGDKAAAAVKQCMADAKPKKKKAS